MSPSQRRRKTKRRRTSLLKERRASLWVVMPKAKLLIMILQELLTLTVFYFVIFLFHDYYGDVYAKCVGPYDGYVASSIWVLKTLVTNKKGPIEKWIPKSKSLFFVGLC